MKKDTGFISLDQYVQIGKILSNEYFIFEGTDAEAGFSEIIDDMELQDMSLEDKLRVLFALRHTRPMFRNLLREEASRIFNMERVIVEAKLEAVEGMGEGERIITGVNANIITPAQAIIAALGNAELLTFLINEIGSPQNNESILLMSNFIVDVFNK